MNHKNDVTFEWKPFSSATNAPSHPVSIVIKIYAIQIALESRYVTRRNSSECDTKR